MNFTILQSLKMGNHDLLCKELLMHHQLPHTCIQICIYDFLRLKFNDRENFPLSFLKSKKEKTAFTSSNKMERYSTENLLKSLNRKLSRNAYRYWSAWFKKDIWIREKVLLRLWRIYQIGKKSFDAF